MNEWILRINTAGLAAVMAKLARSGLAACARAGELDVR